MFCDRCSRTYTHVFSNCTICGGALRDFEVPYNEGEEPAAVTSPVKIGLADIAKYPFLPEAGEYMRRYDLSLFDSPEMAWILDRAVARIKAAMRGELTVKRLDSDEQDLLAFISSVLIIRTLDQRKATNKFAMFEAQRVETYLVRDLISGKNDFILLKIFQETAGVKLAYDNELKFYKMKIPDYLTLSANIKEQEWKLVNMPVDKGYVLLDVEQAVRLVREVIFQVLKSRLAGMHLKQVPEQIRVKVDELRQEFKAVFEMSTVQTVPGAFPPCIVKAVEMLKRGENLPNSGRLMLATYMLARRRPVDAVVDLFRNAPDFNEKTTRYHVERFAKQAAERPSCPGCAWIRGNNLCFADSKCESISHPLQYDRVYQPANV